MRWPSPPPAAAQQGAEVALAGDLVDDAAGSTPARRRSTDASTAAGATRATIGRDRRSPASDDHAAPTIAGQRRRSATTYTKLRWVCTIRLATPTTHGAITQIARS